VQLCEVETLLRDAKEEGVATALDTLKNTTSPTRKWRALHSKFCRVKDKNEKNDSDKRVVSTWNELVDMVKVRAKLSQPVTTSNACTANAR